MLLAAAVLLVAGCNGSVRAKEERTPDDADPSNCAEAVAEVVATAERPAWLMPEVVVCANSMPEVVAHAAQRPLSVAALTRPAVGTAN